MVRHVLGNGKIRIEVACVESRSQLYQRFLAFISPYFLSERVDGEIDLHLGLHEEASFLPEWKTRCTGLETIRRSTAEAFNLELSRGELSDGTQIAWNERDQTGYAFVPGSKRMDLYISDSSFIHLIEFFRYYCLLLEAGKGSVLLHASAVENLETGEVLAIGGVKGAGKTTTMLNLVGSGKYGFFSGDKLLVDLHEGALRVRGWPDYPHVGVGSLRHHPELCRKLGLLVSELPMSEAEAGDKYLFAPELFYGALGKPRTPNGRLEGLLLPDILGKAQAPSLLYSLDKEHVDQRQLFEDPYGFTTANWHRLANIEMTDSVRELHREVYEGLYSVKWLKTSGHVSAEAIELQLRMPNAIKIALVAPSGSGKSTAASLIKQAFEQRGLSVLSEKLAQPLYDLQAAYFETASIDLPSGVQHQKLLENIATNLRMLSKDSLVQHLFSRLVGSNAEVIITDDLRDKETDWPALVNSGYRVIRVACDEPTRIKRLQGRQDIQSQLKSPLDNSINSIESHYVLENNSTLDALEREVQSLVDTLLGHSHGN
ncbi:hypothetical protein Q672_18995 [Marinobacter sp. EVN1]|uniref:hypothetical protein n=1 Tax=Marinobacter sp. EVN1 TaxID=1397532 RepID=UPI0003B889C8|nr:hypothetical protein [Marinobacter sp. EVN1]ERS84729.1 hypothetical protein Q672_18995 [Marinobacter sp. EVN1]